MRRLSVIAVVAILIATGCGDDDDGESATPDSPKATQAFSVQLDGDTDAFNGEFGAFFPNTLSAHPGDTLNFEMPRASGVPHTVTFGTLVDKGVSALEQLGPTAIPDAQENAPDMLNLPDLFPHKSPSQGPPDANQSAAQACYLESGIPPLSLTGSAPACPKKAQPEFTGTQTFYNMGLIGDDGDMVSMKLADSIQPGTYSFICLIHRGVMTGELTVAAEGTAVPGPDAVKAAGKKQFDDLVAAVTPAAVQARQATPDKAALGTGNPQYPSAVVAEFGPKTVSIPVGGSVTWNQFAFHSLTFGASDADIGVVTEDPDGTVHLTKGGGPEGFEVPPNLFDFPQPASGKPVLVDLGSYDGKGFRNTGVPGSLPPVFISYKLTFTKAGTYPVQCLVHPDMKGEVKVG